MRANGKNNWTRFVWAVAAVLGMIHSGFAQEEGSAASKEARASLEKRLQALEREESAMAEIATRLDAGEEVKIQDLWKTWVPPAVYRSSLAGPLGATDITGAAFEEATQLLKSKEAEMKNLEALRVQVETGEKVESKDMEQLGGLGLDARESALADHLAEVEALRDQLEELRFQERFLRAADLNEVMDGENVSPEVADTKVRVEQPILPTEEDEIAGATARKQVTKARIVTSLVALAETCYRAKQYQKAWEALESIDRAAHEQGDRILYLIGRCREKLGDLQGARDSYNELAKAYPESFWAEASTFALTMVNWKADLGPIQGAPAEVYKVINAVSPAGETAGVGEEGL